MSEMTHDERVAAAVRELQEAIRSLRAVEAEWPLGSGEMPEGWRRRSPEAWTRVRAAGQRLIRAVAESVE